MRLVTDMFGGGWLRKLRQVVTGSGNFVVRAGKLYLVVPNIGSDTDENSCYFRILCSDGNTNYFRGGFAQFFRLEEGGFKFIPMSEKGYCPSSEFVCDSPKIGGSWLTIYEISGTDLH